MSISTKRPSAWAEVFKYVVSAIILAAGIAAMSLLSLMAEKPENVAPDALIPLVKTIDAMPYTGRLDTEVSGTVVPFREIRLAAQVAGRIVKKYEACEAGHFVTKGTKLLEIDRTDYELDLKSTQADIEQAQKSIDEVEQDILGAQRNLTIAENDYKLQKEDYDRILAVKGSISQSEVNTAERGLLAAESQIVQNKNSIASLKARKAKLQASLEVTKTQLAKINLNLERTTIMAPADGVIVKEMTEQDNIVRVGDELLTFEDVSHAEILCNLSTTDINWIRENSSGELGELEVKGFANVYRLPRSTVTIFDNTEPSIRWQGVLERFDGIGRDEVTKTFPCRIVVRNPVIESEEGPRALVRGMYVKCQIEVFASAGSDDREFITFPTMGLRPGNYVWVVRDNKLKRIEVDVVDHTEGIDKNELEKPFVIVRKHSTGIQNGDQIVISPLAQPIDGGIVQLESELEQETAVADKPEESTDERRSVKRTADATSADPS